MAHRELTLVGKWGAGRVTLIDEEDYVWLAKRSCWLTEGGYVATTDWCDRDHRDMYVHRWIMERYHGILGTQSVDHINGDRLDNRKTNLRLTNHQGNARNAKSTSPRKTSRYKGVIACKKGRTMKYVASITVDGVSLNLGSYVSERDAAAAYDLKARELFGEFARINDIPLTPEEEKRLRTLMNDRRLRNGWAARYMGVHRSGKTTWRARVQGVHLGTFDSQEEAAEAVRIYTLKEGIELRPR